MSTLLSLCVGSSLRCHDETCLVPSSKSQPAYDRQDDCSYASAPQSAASESFQLPSHLGVVRVLRHPAPVEHVCVERVQDRHTLPLQPDDSGETEQVKQAMSDVRSYGPASADAAVPIEQRGEIRSPAQQSLPHEQQVVVPLARQA